MIPGWLSALDAALDAALSPLDGVVASWWHQLVFMAVLWLAMSWVSRRPRMLMSSAWWRLRSQLARRGERTALYRWYHADEDWRTARPGYIGVSYDVLRREAQHSADLRVFMEGDVQRRTEWFPSRAGALTAERAAIRAERPRHNVIHNGRRRRVAA